MGRPKLIKVDVVDGRGLGGAKNKTVTVQRRIPDIMIFRDAPIFAYLLLAANPQVSISVLRDVLDAVAQPHTETWLYSRKQLLKKPEVPSRADSRAVEYVRAHMNQRVRKSQSALRSMGVPCSLRDLYSIWAAIQHSSGT